MSSPDEITAFLAKAGWENATACPIAGDASGRTFTRLVRAERDTAILMDASGEVRGSSKQFAEISAWINAHGFSAPRIYSAAPESELLLVEDFGDQLFARLLEREPHRETELYSAAAEFLCEFQRQAAMPGLPVLDGLRLATLTELVGEWYIPAIRDAKAPVQTRIPALIVELYDVFAGKDSLVTSLRDFHAENTVWLPERTGVARIGLLDFQDAVQAHPAYDLVSFLQDARRDLLPGTEAAMLALFCRCTDRDPAAFSRIYALIGAQRALRILAVFARLILQSGKPRYASFIPRVWRHLQSNLRHPALSPLADAVRDAIPEPTPARIEGLVARCPAA